MDRDQHLTALRPKVPVFVQEGQTSSAEQFQNCCLRPILKLQNDLILELFRAYVIKRKGLFFRIADREKRDYIANSLRKDLRFRSLMQGLIVGQFTIEEWRTYEHHEAELSRRLVEMMIERIDSQREKIKTG